MKAFDLSRYQRLIGVESERIRGNFYALSTEVGGRIWIYPTNVTIWDERRLTGRTLFSGDFAASVRSGLPRISKHMINPSLLAAVEDVWDEMLAVLVLVTETFEAGAVGEGEGADGGPFAPDECTGAYDCDAPIHVHGCYRPHRADQCDSPEEYGHISPVGEGEQS